ncbi:3-hydroxyisobutyrate dehydrogenase [Candidatus Odyssella thessalonicensis]|uniref:3-hydroxyisobutyrate dehydrogenase n=1 Tax=Candidatus Odyssella thessalonicensis TaxID=84647 RepID=UPI000225BED1|nr:3-hydroxyisobutyrate dehydrogenase [Candidatus Odyssella thessalonicensis]
MAKIGFIGLGHMGNPMARNLVKAHHEVHVFDLDRAAIETAVRGGCIGAYSLLEVASDKDFIITMLPAGKHVRSVLLGENGLLEQLKEPGFFIDCSTIDLTTTQDVHEAATFKGHGILDAPVSGGVAGAEKATLTFMVGGLHDAFIKAQPILASMGKNVFHAGAATHGQVAKMCNNLMLGIHMIGTSEAFILAEKLGLAASTLYEIASASSGQSWTLSRYCPAPVLPDTPACNGYKAGFAAAMMLKDLNLAIEAARNNDTTLPLTEKAGDLYDDFCRDSGALDFSAIIEFLKVR